MGDRGRRVLWMVVACALAGVLAPAADAHHNTRRSSAPPKAPDGFVAISELEVSGVALH